MKKLIVPIVIGLLLAIGAYFYFQPTKSEDQTMELTTIVEKGKLDVVVTATGELNAKRSVKIRGPQGMRPAGVYETTISDMVAEGSLLKKGDYVATLDRTEIANKMTTIQTELDKVLTQLEQAKIDTAIEMRGLRDEMINMDFTMKEKRLKLEESKYEPQSVIKSAELDMERTQRDFNQLKKRYSLKEQQAEAKVKEIRTLLKQNQIKMDRLQDLSNKFTINAPEDGMLIYLRNWRGKTEPGSRVNAWDPVVAELPDLTDMISKTYVNEVDISKVQLGQEVTVRVDAFPDNSYTGLVLELANIGEQLRGYDAKVFEVIVQVNEIDSIMRPAMTTSIEILTNSFEDVVYVPIEGVFTDSLSFVYKKEGNKIIKQEVITGMSNDTDVIIEFGIEKGEEIYLIRPEGEAELSIQTIDEATKNQVLQQQMIAMKKRQAEAMKRKEKIKGLAAPNNEGGSSGGTVVFF
ncbi:MAG: HlyD family efflux transporter periplasmic adaptor subunit [Bacteroidota bacterium]